MVHPIILLRFRLKGVTKPGFIKLIYGTLGFPKSNHHIRQAPEPVKQRPDELLRGNVVSGQRIYVIVPARVS